MNAGDFQKLLQAADLRSKVTDELITLGDEVERTRVPIPVNDLLQRIREKLREEIK